MPAIKNAPLAALAACLLATTACTTTYLNSGQLGFDSVAPIPRSRQAGDGSSTAIFAGGSYAVGSAYSDDDNLMAQAGIAHGWRAGSGGSPAFDGNLALSGWYGRARLADHGYGGDRQYPLSVAEPFPFFGASAQFGEALGWRIANKEQLDVGMRLGAAYEGGEYRAFRSKARSLSGRGTGYDIVDSCPSGLSGSLGADIAYTHSISENRALRFGIGFGGLKSDLTMRSELPLLYFQPAFSLRIDKAYVSAAYNGNAFLNKGLILAAGYIIR